MMQPFLCFELIVLLSFVNGKIHAEFLKQILENICISGAPLHLTEDEKKAAFSALYGPEGNASLEVTTKLISYLHFR